MHKRDKKPAKKVLYKHINGADLQVAEKLDFQTGTLVEVRQRNNNQWPNSYFCDYCG